MVDRRKVRKSKSINFKSFIFKK